MSGWSALDYPSFVAEYAHTWPRHRGVIELAAPIFNLTTAAMEARLRRARAKGHHVEFHYFEERAQA